MAKFDVRTALELRYWASLRSLVGSAVKQRGAEDFRDQIRRCCAPSLGLHQRHGQAIWGVLKAAVENHSTDLVKRSLPPSSVLMRASCAHAPRRLPPLEDACGRCRELDWPNLRPRSGSGDKDDGTELSDQPPARAHERSRRQRAGPPLELARGAIEELYPNGLFGYDRNEIQSSAGKVGDWLKSNKKSDVSDATILRAAGRRK